MQEKVSIELEEEPGEVSGELEDEPGEVSKETEEEPKISFPFWTASILEMDEETEKSSWGFSGLLVSS